MSIFIKICGITNVVDANLSVEYGADAIGLNQYEKSPRYVSDEELIKIKNSLDDDVLIVPVFVNPKEDEVYKFLKIYPKSVLQFHGNESLEFCKKFNRPFIKSMNLNDSINAYNYQKEYASAKYFLLDSGNEDLYGGTGKNFDWKKIPQDFNNLIIAGGLNTNNILTLLDYFIPFGVDVCSGVESKKGVKDSLKLKKFIDLIKNYER